MVWQCCLGDDELREVFPPRRLVRAHRPYGQTTACVFLFVFSLYMWWCLCLWHCLRFPLFWCLYLWCLWCMVDPADCNGVVMCDVERQRVLCLWRLPAANLGERSKPYCPPRQKSCSHSYSSNSSTPATTSTTTEMIFVASTTSGAYVRKKLVRVIFWGLNAHGRIYSND